MSYTGTGFTATTASALRIPASEGGPPEVLLLSEIDINGLEKFWSWAKDGSDCRFIYLIGGFKIKDLGTVELKVKNGMKVRAVWQDVKVGSIMDIKYFELIFE